MIGIFITQCTHSCITSRAEVVGKTWNPPGDSGPLQPRFGGLWLLTFPKTKIPFEREVISDCQWDSGKYDGAADGDSNRGFCWVFWTVEGMLGEMYEVPRCFLWKGLKHHYPLYKVSCILYLLQLISQFFIAHGWILSRQTSYTWLPSPLLRASQLHDRSNQIRSLKPLAHISFKA